MLFTKAYCIYVVVNIKTLLIKKKILDEICQFSFGVSPYNVHLNWIQRSLSFKKSISDDVNF